MPINMREVKLFASTGRLIKSIPLSELPKELPGIISYAGNIFVQGFYQYEYVERSVHVYEEKPLAPSAKPVEGDEAPRPKLTIP